MSLRRAAGTAVATLLLGAAAEPAAAPTIDLDFSPPTNLSSSTRQSQAPSLALGPTGAVYAAWEEFGGGAAFSRSLNDGLSFSTAWLLFADQGPFSYAGQKIAVSGDTAHIVAAEYYDYGTTEVVYRRTDDAGATFSPPVYLSTLDSYYSYAPTVATGWATAVAWNDTDISTGVSPAIYTQSLDGGHTFSAPRMISEPGTQALCPSIALTGPQTVYTAWYYLYNGLEGVAFSRSLDGGVTFSPPVHLTEKPVKGWCPRLAVNGAGILHMVWDEGPAWTDRVVFYARSTDGGVSWSPPTRLSETYVANAVSTDFAIAPDGALFVSWLSVQPTSTDGCHLTRSTDGGLTFAQPARGVGCEALAVRSANDIHVAYHNGTSAAEVWHSRVAVKPGDPLRGFHTVEPCRLADTRLSEGPALAHGELRAFAVAGRCGVPSEAKAVAVNVTLVSPTGPGYLTLFPASAPVPGTSTLNFSPGRTIANSALVALGAGGGVTAFNGMSAGSSHLLIDVTGYFR
jgi:hypothetical protein